MPSSGGIPTFGSNPGWILRDDSQASGYSEIITANNAGNPGAYVIASNGVNTFVGVNGQTTTINGTVATGGAFSSASSVSSGSGRFENSTTTASLFLTAGVPGAGLGANGDYALSQAGGAGAHLYFKSAGAWAAVT